MVAAFAAGIDNTQCFNIFPAGTVPGGTDIHRSGGAFDLVLHNKNLSVWLVLYMQ
jgi:hypothetical protein